MPTADSAAVPARSTARGASAPPALELRGLAKRFGALVATDAVSLEVRPGELHALIGPNGAGKSTLIAQIGGALRPDAGDVRLDGVSLGRASAHARARRGLARSFQITSVFAKLTVRDNARLAAQAAQQRRGRGSFGMFDRRDGDAATEAQAVEILARVGLDGRADAIAGTLSHGEQRQLELALALAIAPRLLLLDEPMAGTGPEESARMVDLLAQLKGSVAMLLVEHDVDAVFRLADRVSVLVAGRVIATGSPDAIRADAAVRAAYLGEHAG
jgi:branched-chain amino acid transport system ATP-binding protein